MITSSFYSLKEDTNINSWFSFNIKKEEEKNTFEKEEEEKFPYVFNEIFNPARLNSTLNLDEEEDTTNKRNIKKIFNIIYPIKASLFTYSEKKLKDKYINFNKHKHKTHPLMKKRRFTYSDNIRKVIKARFFNTSLKNALNKLLKSEGYEIFFTNFPKNFVHSISIRDEKINIEKKMFDILDNENNSELISRIKKDKNSELNIILNKTYRQLFEEYLNSKEYNDEIKRLEMSENNQKDTEYIEKYIYLAEHFIEFFSQ